MAVAKWGSIIWGSFFWGGLTAAMPIDDRTAADAAYAKKHPEATADLRGAWNVSDHVRCEDNIKFIVALMSYLSMVPPAVTYINPTVASLGWAAYFNTLAANIEALRKKLLPSTASINYPDDVGFGDYKTLNTALTGAAKGEVDYIAANAYEKDLSIIKDKLKSLPGEWLYCGSFYSGDDIQVQLLQGVV